MPFTAQELDEIESLLCGAQGGPDLLTVFRNRFPGRSLTRCDAADMSEESPFRRLLNADLYLVDGRQHCWQITTDPASATGVVFAVRSAPSVVA
ncbi:MAG: hypothetical protein ABSF94_15730 [Steroidobacteraceae bacterium]|jgi:hypothetical protein